VEITASYPAGVIGTTAENLKEAAEGENIEHTKLYPEAARIAEEEGFKDIAFLFRKVAEVEVHHEQRYLMLLKNLKEGRVFKRETKEKWICRNCGYIHEGNEPPDKCPTCEHPRAYFELLCDHF